MDVMVSRPVATSVLQSYKKGYFMINFAEKFFEFSASVSEQPTDRNGRVLFFDGLNTYLRAFAATPTMCEEGRHVGGITGFLLSVAATVRLLRPTRVVICFDGKGGSTRRRQMFADYKGNRRSMTKLNRTYDFASLEEEKESQKWQLLTLISMLDHIPVTVMAPELVEADDVIAYLAQLTEERGGKAIIVSTDKDFLQLVNENISVYNPIKKKQYHVDGVIADYGFHPSNFLMYRMVTGDNSDGIPGVEGIKEATLLKHFPELASGEPRDVNYMLERAEAIQEERKKKTPVAIKTLLDSRELLERNFALMRLDDVAMGTSSRVKAIDAFDGPINTMNKYEFQKWCINLKIVHTFGNFDSWFASSWATLSGK